LNVQRMSVEVSGEVRTYALDLDTLWGHEAVFIEDLTGLSTNEWSMRVGNPVLRRGKDLLLLAFMAASREQTEQLGRSGLLWEQFIQVVNLRSFAFLDDEPEPDENDGDGGGQAADEPDPASTEDEPPADDQPAAETPAKPARSRARRAPAKKTGTA